MDKDARAALLTAKSHVPVAVQRSSIPEGYADGGSISDDADGEDDDPGHDTDDIGFYSKAADAAAALPQASGTPAQMFGMLTGTGGKPWQGVKPEEMEWSGVKEAFKDHPTVTRDQLVQHFKQHSPQLKETKFALKDKPKLYEDGYETSYYHGPHAPVGEELMTPGGTNYREVVVHTPVLPNQATQRDRDLGYRQGRTEDDFVTPVSRQTHPVDAFEGAHHTIPNVVGHLLMKDREGSKPIDPESKKRAELLGHEFQNIARQQQRLRLDRKKVHYEKEFRQDMTLEEIERLHRKSDAAAYDELVDNPVYASNSERLDEIVRERNKILSQKPEKILHVDEIQSDWGQKGKKEGFRSNDADSLMAGQPEGPWVQNTQGWTDLLLKRALIEAAKGGHDRLVISPGKAAAERYGQSRRVSSVSYFPEDKTLVGFKENGYEAHRESNVKPEDLHKFLGENAAKMKDKTRHRIDQIIKYKHYAPPYGETIDMGGHGMKDYYDKIVPTRLQKLLKSIDPESVIEHYTFDHPADPRRYNDTSTTGISVRMTPKLRAAILRGLPKFKRGGEVRPNHAIIDKALRVTRKTS